ncbi:MAG: PQQ-binding-like beta-propeller repeat protein [Chloroflexota bacterium]
MKKANRFISIAALALLASLLSACGGTPAAQSWPGLAADDTAAYLANGAVVYAVNLKDGEQLWQFPAEGEVDAKLAFYSNPVFTSDGQLLVGSSGTTNTLFRLDPANEGRETWSFAGADDHWVASPLVVGETVYAPNANGTLYVFDMSIQGDDKLAWTITLGGKLWSSPVADDQFVYVVSLDHQVHAVNIATRELAWSVELDGANTGAPALANDLLIVGSFSETLNAFHVADGSPAWSAPAKAWVWSAPIVDGDTLYFADLDGNFYALNAADGTALMDSIRPDGPVVASPLPFNGKVILVAENGTVYAIDAEGKFRSLETFKGKLYTAPVIAGDVILVAPFKGDFLLAALDQDGGIVWRFPKEEK